MSIEYRRHAVIVAGATLWAVAAPAISAQPASSPSTALVVPSIPVERFTLPNGLTVLLSPDTAAPVVTVTVWYHVGSKNEHTGRTGFAHLFEHLMFQGSQHVGKTDHIKMIEDAGGSANGTTNNDRTNYFETVPANYLATVLWMEADRMGGLLSALNQEKLDNQRDVVKNERRYRVDNQPFGRAGEVLDGALFPPSNPYSWPVIGSMADLSAATLADVSRFFRTYYAPNNATLAICGDIDPARTRSLVDTYFGRIPRGPVIVRPKVQPATLASQRRLVLEDATARLPRLQISWPGVGVHSRDAAALDAAAAILTQDRTSRLTKLLVYDLELATNVSASSENDEDEGSIHIRVSPLPNVSLTRLEQLVDSVIGTLRAAPPTQDEVDRTKRYAVVGTITGLESTEDRAEALASGMTFFKDPLRYEEQLRESQTVTPADVERVVRQYLGPGHVVLSMVPAGKLNLASKPTAAFTNVTKATGGCAVMPAFIRRSAWRVALGAIVSQIGFARPSCAQSDSAPPRPVPGPAPTVRIPPIEMRTLHNGVRVAVLERHDFPVVDVRALVVAPALLDPVGREGVSSLTAQMLAEGTVTRSAEAIATAESELGTAVSATGFFTIPRYVEQAAALMADQLLYPAFPQKALDRIRANTIARLQRLRDVPTYLAGRVFVSELYGSTHPAARRPTEASVGAITRADLVAFHTAYYRPRNLTVIVAGDITPDRAVAVLEPTIGALALGGEDGSAPPPAPPAGASTQIYLYDRPSSAQSVIYAGEFGPPRDSPDYYVLELLNTVFGGAFNSRLNLSLREVHGYTYGASSGFDYRRVPQPSIFEVETEVSTPTTDSSLVDLAAELRAIRDAKPVTDSELAFAKRTATLSLPIQFATVPEAADAAAMLLEFNLPLDYFDHLTRRFEGVTLAETRAAAQRYLDPDHLIIVVVGDRKLIEPGLNAAHLAPVVVVDSLGK